MTKFTGDGHLLAPHEAIQQAAQQLQEKINRWKQIEEIVLGHPEWLTQDERLAILFPDETKSAA